MDNYKDNESMGMDWDDSIQNDGQDYIILPEGDYTFIVKEFERGRFPGSEKIQPCNKATLTLVVSTPEGNATAKTDLILYRTLEWKLSQFFRSIGMKKQGERLVMDWSRVTGSTGKAHFKPRTYTDKWNNTKQVNEVAYFIDANQTKQNSCSPAENDDIPF